jgi:signal transduction histidine kinase
VTDLTESRRNEELLRALSHRQVQTQEAERGRVALELHDHITQLLCAVLVRCQTLADKLPAGAGPAKAEARRLRALLGQTAGEVERISHDLRPGILEYLGLAAVLRDTSNRFAQRTGVSVRLACVHLTERPAPNIELALYRILDDGVGFNARRPPGGRPAKGGLGLLAMRERAAYMGGELQVKSTPRAGTEIKICIPLPAAPAAN